MAKSEKPREVAVSQEEKSHMNIPNFNPGTQLFIWPPDASAQQNRRNECKSMRASGRDWMCEYDRKSFRSKINASWTIRHQPEG